MTTEERGIVDLNRRLEEGRRGFGGGSGLRPPHPSRPASPFRRLMVEHYGALLGIACLLAAFALMLEPVS